jgi:hypothetical protein
MATQYPGDKDKQPQQKDFDKAWDNTQKGKTMPNENDMGPLPKTEPKKETTKPVKKFSKGGSASARADGCATKGKTKGRII